MSEIRNVNPEEMIATANNIKGEIEAWNAAVADIYALQAELDAMWDGDANTEFNNQWAEDRPKYDTLAQAMTEYCQTVADAANLYIQREDEIRGIVAQR